MAQDAQDAEEGQGHGGGSVDTSHELDMVPLYRSSTVDAGVEADIIRGILDSNGIPSLMSRAAGYPSLGFAVHVHRGNVQHAERVIEEAKAAGPAAAMEAERALEESR
jgi:hypothetical protein